MRFEARLFKTAYLRQFNYQNETTFLPSPEIKSIHHIILYNKLWYRSFNMNFMMFNNYFLIFYWICSISPVYGLYNFVTKCFYKRFLSSNTLRHIVFVTIPAEIDSAHSYSIFCLTSGCGLNSPLQVCSSVSHAYNIHHSWILSSIIKFKVMLG